MWPVARGWDSAAQTFPGEGGWGPAFATPGEPAGTPAFGSPFAWLPLNVSASPRTAAWSSTTRTATAATPWRTVSSASPATSSGWRKAPRPQPCTSTTSSGASPGPRGAEGPGRKGQVRLLILGVELGGRVRAGEGGGVASECLRACVGPFPFHPTGLGVYSKGLARCPARIRTSERSGRRQQGGQRREVVASEGKVCAERIHNILGERVQLPRHSTLPLPPGKYCTPCAPPTPAPHPASTE